MPLFGKGYDYSWSYRKIEWFLLRLVTIMINVFFLYFKDSFTELIIPNYMSNMFLFWNKIDTIFVYKKEKSLLHDQPQKRRYLIYDVEMTGNMTIVIVFLTYRVSRIPWSEIIQVKRKPPISWSGPRTAAHYWKVCVWLYGLDTKGLCDC